MGHQVENVELKDIALPEEMKRVIAKVAEAEREKAAVITKAQGEVDAANNLAHAAEIMSSTPGALHLRTLSTLNDLSSDQSNTIIFAIQSKYYVLLKEPMSKMSFKKLQIRKIKTKKKVTDVTF